MKKYRVIEWATGVVGTAALKRIIEHPELELAGVKVYSDDKTGRDAGELAGLSVTTGVLATQDVDAIIATDADCIIYCPMPWDLDEMCRILKSGKHVITPCPYWFPWKQNPEVTSQIEEACRTGGVNLHASGCNPGGIAERFPLTFSGWCNRIDRITITEYGDCRDYASEAVIREVMNLGKTPETAKDNPIQAILANSWYEPIDMIAEGLGCEIIKYESDNDYIMANQDIDTAAGVIEKGTIALNRSRHVAQTREGTEIVEEQIWFMDDLHQTRLESKLDIPRDSGWRIRIEGDVNLIFDVQIDASEQKERTAQAIQTTGFHCVNAVPLVCDAPNPGLKTYLDLNLIAGRMGTHTER